MGLDLLRNRSHPAHRARAALWRCPEAFGRPLCHDHSDRSVRHADYRRELRTHGCAISDGGFGLHLRGPRAQSALGISGGLGDDPGLPAAAAHQHGLDFYCAARALPAAGSVYRVGGAHRRDHDVTESRWSQVIGARQQGAAGGDVGGRGLLRLARDSLLVAWTRVGGIVID